jgi:hypothetical protein
VNEAVSNLNPDQATANLNAAVDYANRKTFRGWLLPGRETISPLG